MDARCVLVAEISIFLSVDRLPAPIVEEEKPTPATGQPETPKRERSRSTATEQSSAQTERNPKGAEPASQGPARFAGTWSGKVNQGLLGHIPTTLTVDANATSVQLSHNLGRWESAGHNRRQYDLLENWSNGRNKLDTHTKQRRPDRAGYDEGPSFE